MNYKEMLEFVKKTLENTNTIRPNNPYHGFRNRYLHSYRVFSWAKRIMDDLECDSEVLLTACIFHDIGYSVEKNNHALYSERIFLRYAHNHGFDHDFSKRVATIIALHSHKELLNDSETMKNLPELILLMEADLLDEEGALGIAWDLLAKGAKGASDYKESLEALKIHSGHILSQDYMVTNKAKMYWNHKKEFVKSFIDELLSDMFMEEE